MRRLYQKAKGNKVRGCTQCDLKLEVYRAKGDRGLWDVLSNKYMATLVLFLDNRTLKYCAQRGAISCIYDYTEPIILRFSR